MVPVYSEGQLHYWLDPQSGNPIFPPSDVDHVEFLHEQADKAQTASRCYFIGGDVGAIKIGHSVSPLERLKAIQSCSPIPLRLLATRPGGAARETAYHTQFCEARQHGEWFERTPALLREIARLTAG